MKKSQSKIFTFRSEVNFTLYSAIVLAHCTAADPLTYHPHQSYLQHRVCSHTGCHNRYTSHQFGRHYTCHIGRFTVTCQKVQTPRPSRPPVPWPSQLQLSRLPRPSFFGLFYSSLPAHFKPRLFGSRHLCIIGRHSHRQPNLRSPSRLRALSSHRLYHLSSPRSRQ